MMLTQLSVTLEVDIVCVSCGSRNGMMGRGNYISVPTMPWASKDAGAVPSSRLSFSKGEMLPL